METSTPENRRRSRAPPSRTSFGGEPFEITPLRRNRPSVAFQLDVPNDDAERAERRKSTALRKSILNLPPAVESPALNESGQALTEDDVKANLQICTKLHAENKINTKNVWSLRIIDILRQLVTKDNPDVLKVAGNSLDIAGKVYGLRVDDLHSEGLKLAENLARTFSNRPKECAEEDEENVDPNASTNEKQRKKKKEKKRRPLLSGDKKHTVNRDPKSWKGPLPKLEPVTFSVKTDSTVSAIENLFTNTLKMDPAGYMFKILDKEPSCCWVPGNDPSVTKDTNTKFSLQIKPVDNLLLCAPFKDFLVDKWDPDEEHEELAKRTKLDEVVCDDNGIPIPELDGSVHDIFEDRDNEDLNDDDAMMIEEQAIPHIHQEIHHIVDFRPSERGTVNFSEKSEYSFNNVITTASGKIDQIWAGPSHWKLKFIRRSRSVYSGNPVPNEQEKKKTRGRRKKIEPIHIDCRTLNDPIDFAKYENKQPKKKKYNMDESKITLPVFDFSCPKLLENIEGLMTIPSMKPTKKLRPDVEYEVDGYRFDNPNDSAYVPHDTGNDHDADLGDEYFDNGDAGTPDIPEGGEMLLVEAPEMAPQSYMHYALKAKKMDMKKLKHAVWCILTDTPDYVTSAKVIPTTFSRMYKEVPNLLPEKMKEEMSCSLAFVALLHLANEQCLKFKQEDFTDFQICGSSTV